MRAELLNRSALAAVLALGLGFPAMAQDAGTLDKDKAEAAHKRAPVYSPYADRDFPTRPFFGDTHLHTSFSMDAGAFGARLDPRDAYRFARGEQITASTGQPAKLSRPLDFLVVADHSDNMGFFPDLFAGKPELLADPTGRKWYDMIQSGKGATAAFEIVVAFSQGTFPKDSHLLPRHARLSQRLAGDDRGGGDLQPAGPRSPPSSAMNGPRIPAATTCIAMSSSATMPTRRARLSRSPSTRPAATIRSSCGNGWTPTRRRPAAACWPSRITAI